MLTTTWHTPGGWLLVHDALTMGPRTGPDHVTPHTRPPADDDAEHVLVRLVECLEGSVEVELVCEPAFDYGREPAGWTLVDEDWHAADATGAGQTFRLSTDMSIGLEGSSARARHTLSKGEKAFCALSWAEGLRLSDGRGRCRRADRAHGRVLAAVAGAGAHPGPLAATPAGAVRADDQGPHLHADRRDGGGADHLPARRRRAASGTGTTATPGCGTRRSPCRPCTS